MQRTGAKSREDLVVGVWGGAERGWVGCREVHRDRFLSTHNPPGQELVPERGTFLQAEQDPTCNRSSSLWHLPVHTGLRIHDFAQEPKLAKVPRRASWGSPGK